jgi:hypothetical protein
MPSNSIIILNDINLGRNDKEPRFYYDLLRDKIKNDDLAKINVRYHFKNNNNPRYFKYGHLHTNNCIKYDVMSEIVGAFEPWESCASAQLLVRLK